MKILFLIIFLLTSLIARENPFEPLFDTPKSTQDIIPLLHITTNKTFAIQEETLIPKPDHTITLEINSTVETNVTVVDKPLAKPIKKEKKVTNLEKKKPLIKKRKYKTIYQNYFLKVQTNYKSFKIFTKDTLLKKVRYKNPERMTFDFDRLQHFHTKNITFNKSFAQKIKLGSHHNFYRITVQLNRYKHYKLIKKPYGYLLTFY